jgi:hypothetical protein|tara:strand:- start:402 stop:599 length:198 start_codon:yes stop_codon:yes gene_type:complete
VKAGDLVRNKATGELAIVKSRGDGDLAIWMTLIPSKPNMIEEEVVYLAEYFELVSEAKASNESKE